MILVRCRWNSKSVLAPRHSRQRRAADVRPVAAATDGVEGREVVEDVHRRDAQAAADVGRRRWPRVRANEVGAVARRLQPVGAEALLQDERTAGSDRVADADRVRRGQPAVREDRWIDVLVVAAVVEDDPVEVVFGLHRRRAGARVGPGGSASTAARRWSGSISPKRPKLNVLGDDHVVVGRRLDEHALVALGERAGCRTASRSASASPTCPHRAGGDIAEVRELGQGLAARG